MARSLTLPSSVDELGRAISASIQRTASGTRTKNDQLGHGGDEFVL